MDSSMRSGRRLRTDLDEQAHHVGVRAAVQRALQRADRRDGGRVQIGQRGRGDAGGKRRGVELVIRVQHQRDV